jgi:hypothetical protein
LAEFFIEVTGLNFCGHILFMVIDFVIPLNEESLSELNDFQCDHQRDWNNIGEDKNPSSKHLERVEHPV